MEYEFRWKAGDLLRRPRFAGPHMPRLDWQMWFAGLSPQRQARWLQGLADGLLEARPDVLGLLQRDPLAGAEPQAVRFALYRYRFTNPEERRESGAWWARLELGFLGPFTHGR